MRRIVIAVALAFAVRVAGADPKNETTASMLSLGGTIVAGVLVVEGIGEASKATPTGYGDPKLAWIGLASAIVLPSLGEWYAEQPLTYGMALRSMGAVTCALAIRYADSAKGDSPGNVVVPVILGAGAVMAVGAFYDIYDAPRAVGRHNARLQLAPTVLTPPSGPVMGVGIGGRF
jgi:hypothetical protein